MNSKTIICFIFSIRTVFLKLCAAEKIKVCRKIFVFKQKAIESLSTDDLCFYVILVLLKILNMGCFSKNVKGKRSFA